jgi:integrase
MAKTRKVEKRVLPSGLITYRAPYIDAAGKRRSKNFPRKADAEAFLFTVASELVQGVHTPASVSPTVKDAAAFWIARCKGKKLKPTSVNAYEEHVDLHIVPFIGTTKLAEVTAPAVYAFADQLQQAGRSIDMIKRVISSLGAIFKEARRRGLSATAPTVGIDLDLPSERRKNPRPVIPTKPELRAVIAAAVARGLRWRAFVLVAIFCGLRASELRGLPWKDVDFIDGVIHVTQRADAYLMIGRCKSESAYRSIPMPPMVVQALREWKLKCPKGELGLVFPNGIGNVESLSNIMQRDYDPIQIAAEVTIRREMLDQQGAPVLGDDGKPLIETVAKYGMHALRHACASLWIEQGFNPKRIQTLMGHSTIQMTYDLYGHLFQDIEADQRAAEDVQNRLFVSG